MRTTVALGITVLHIIGYSVLLIGVPGQNSGWVYLLLSVTAGYVVYRSWNQKNWWSTLIRIVAFFLPVIFLFAIGLFEKLFL